MGWWWDSIIPTGSADTLRKKGTLYLSVSHRNFIPTASFIHSFNICKPLGVKYHYSHLKNEETEAQIIESDSSKPYTKGSKRFKPHHCGSKSRDAEKAGVLGNSFQEGTPTCRQGVLCSLCPPFPTSLSPHPHSQSNFVSHSKALGSGLGIFFPFTCRLL